MGDKAVISISNKKCMKRKRRKSNKRHWSWYISALFYKLSYIKLAHQLDKDLFNYLGDRVQGAVVADCGCGPGVVSEKFLGGGASRVFAIDGNPNMLRQVQSRLKDALVKGDVVDIQSRFNNHLFSDLQRKFLENKGLDIILFKRSLYSKPKQAKVILKAALASLNQGGIIIVIHAERSLYKYAFGPRLRIKVYTAYHLFNRSVSFIGDKIGIGEYTLYTRKELIELLQKTASDMCVESIPSQQRAYNLVAVKN